MDNSTSNISPPGDDALAVLIDADNISPSSVDEVFQIVQELGNPIVRHAFGMMSCFSANGGWAEKQRKFGLIPFPQMSNVAHKNAADIALVVDAISLLYTSSCQGFCLVSSDSDFTCVAAKIREAGKNAFGLGGAKTPVSFRSACTKFFELSSLKPTTTADTKVKIAPICPRCGGGLTKSVTRLRQTCEICEACGGVLLPLSSLKKSFAEESLAEMQKLASQHLQAGGTCPHCGTSMSLLRVASDKQSVEIDVCDKCKAIWYDKNEYETIVPGDGILLPNISAGKAYRRELVLLLDADLRNGRLKPPSIGSLKSQLKKQYFVPRPDIDPLISTLQCQKVISIQANGSLTIMP
ncbi:MAG: NYN domain-containing protein [Victivallales bacterium]|nr:NYN domain-containing protein [Victivallales bacterium]